MKNIYVGNLSLETKEQRLGELFSAFGSIARLEIVKDRFTGESKGFAFVEMDDEPADLAISTLNGQELDGKRLKVTDARPRKERIPPEPKPEGAS